MPLPDEPTTDWPPPEHAGALQLYRKWAAWWSGDVDELSRVYASAIGYGDPVVDARDDRPAMAGAQTRMFHGTPPAKGALKKAKLHIPLASDIATTSADLLFGESPVLVVADDAASKRAADRKRAGRPAPRKVAAKASPTQDRLDDYLANGLQAVLLEAAEIAAAFGGVYLRVGWDAKIGARPLFDAIPPDAAIPEFRSGQLVAVTFHRKLRPIGDDGFTWRHLERHEPGQIFHGLYRSGDAGKLGEKRDLKDHPETEAFAALVGAGGMVETGATGLAAEYVPNMRPHRRLRGSLLGRSDLDGIETLMDSLDEAWSSWMRDLRLGKGRILIPSVYLESTGRGQGALFDLEQEVFESVDALPKATDGLAMQAVQFTIRVTEHEQTCSSLIEQAVRAAGYSAQSFGMQGDGGLATATEVNARIGRSLMTRAKKINYFRPPVARLARTALEIDIKQFRPDGVTAVLPDVEWPDGIATDPQQQAQTLAALKAAEAASTRTRVEIWNPDWDDTRVAEEVRQIREEAQPEPAELAFPGTGPAGNTADDKAGKDAAAGPAASGKPGAAAGKAGASSPAAATPAGDPRPGGPRTPARRTRTRA